MKRKQWMAALLALVLMLTMSVPALAADTPSEEVVAPSEVSHVPLEDAAQTACTAAMAYGAADSISWAVWEEGEITTSGSFHGQRDVAQDSLLIKNFSLGIPSFCAARSMILMFA